jgi:hypothetical protein
VTDLFVLQGRKCNVLHKYDGNTTKRFWSIQIISLLLSWNCSSITGTLLQV